eukprot:2269259-Lingulodinium_polyedra.AAC.1
MHAWSGGKNRRNFDAANNVRLQDGRLTVDLQETAAAKLQHFGAVQSAELLDREQLLQAYNERPAAGQGSRE